MSRVGTIVEQIASLVARGALKPGQRLPSVRAGAVEHGVSKNTMADAYDRLVAMGHLQARPGSGYYVAAPRALSSAQRPRPEIGRAAWREGVWQYVWVAGVDVSLKKK